MPSHKLNSFKSFQLFLLDKICFAWVSLTARGLSFVKKLGVTLFFADLVAVLTVLWL